MECGEYNCKLFTAHRDGKFARDWPALLEKKQSILSAPKKERKREKVRR
jgi:hypothetical protein